jgi:hypothetical protein
MLEHIEFWTGPECLPLSTEDMELVKRLADVVGVTQGTGKGMEYAEIGAENN